MEIEFSKDIENANIGILGGLEDGKKVVKFYKVDRETYTPKFKVKEVSKNTKDLQELADNSNFLGKLVFNHNESIESLMFILSELYRLEE